MTRSWGRRGMVDMSNQEEVAARGQGPNWRDRAIGRGRAAEGLVPR